MDRGLPSVATEHLSARERYGLRLILFGAAIVIVAVPFSLLLFEVLAKGPLTRFDAAVANTMNDLVHGHRWLVVTLQGVSWLGRPPFLALLVIPSTIFVWRRGEMRLVAFLLVTPLGGGIVDTLVKALVDRPRPHVDHPVVTAFGKSFPSGHAMSSLVTYGALILVFLPLLPRARRHLAVGGDQSFGDRLRDLFAGHGVQRAGTDGVVEVVALRRGERAQRTLADRAAEDVEETLVHGATAA